MISRPGWRSTRRTAIRSAELHVRCMHRLLAEVDRAGWGAKGDGDDVAHAVKPAAPTGGPPGRPRRPQPLGRDRGAAVAAPRGAQGRSRRARLACPRRAGRTGRTACPPIQPALPRSRGPSPSRRRAADRAGGPRRRLEPPAMPVLEPRRASPSSPWPASEQPLGNRPGRQRQEREDPSRSKSRLSGRSRMPSSSMLSPPFPRAQCAGERARQRGG